VYVVGGLDAQGTSLSTVLRFDGASQTWSAVAPLPEPLHHANVGVVNGKLYVVGVLAPNFAARADVLEYDPATDRWTARAPLPAAQRRGASAVGVIGDELIVAGGLRGGAAVTDVTAYDPRTDTHRTLAPLPSATEHVVGAAVGSKLYVIGGRDGSIASITARVDVYDATTGTWARGPDLPTGRGGHAAAVLDGRIVVFGGEGHHANAGVFPHAEVFDTLTSTWARALDMPTPRHGTGAAALRGRIIVPGGATVQGVGAVTTVEAFSF
jgi:N-acetylneuraminic acid mutarotase